MRRGRPEGPAGRQPPVTGAFSAVLFLNQTDRLYYGDDGHGAACGCSLPSSFLLFIFLCFIFLYLTPAGLAGKAAQPLAPRSAVRGLQGEASPQPRLSPMGFSFSPREGPGGRSGPPRRGEAAESGGPGAGSPPLPPEGSRRPLCVPRPLSRGGERPSCRAGGVPTVPASLNRENAFPLVDKRTSRRSLPPGVGRCGGVERGGFLP